MTSDTGTLKIIDHYLGLPVCVLFSLWYGLLRLVFGQRRPAQTPRRVLVIKFFGLGSIGYSTVIARDFRAAFPDAEITLLTFRNNLRFVKCLRTYDRVLTIDRSRAPAFLFGTISMLLRNLFRRWDVCIDLERFSKYTTIHTAFTHARVRIGFFLPVLWRRFIYTRNAYFNTAKHMRRIYGFVAELAGVPKSLETPARLEVEDADAREAERLLREIGWDGAPYIGVNVNASDLSYGRRWPPERFARLIESVAERGSWVFLTGAPNERDYTQSCMDQVDPKCHGRIRNVAGAFTIEQFLAFLKGARLFVTNDSGPGIFAIFLDTPSVSIWGPSDPNMFGGDSPRHTPIYRRLACSPCMYIPGIDTGFFCDNRFPCMTDITTEEATAAVLARLS